MSGAEATAGARSAEEAARPPAPVHLAVLGNCPSPYRTAQHLRFVRELPDLRISSVFLYERSAHAWDNPLPDEIGPVLLSPGASIVGRHRPSGVVGQLRNARRSWAWLSEHRPDVLLLTGYADIAFGATMAWCRRHRVPYILYSDSNVAGDRPRRPVRWAKTAYLRAAVRGAHVIGTPGRAGLRYYERYGGSSRPTVFLPPQPDFASIRGRPGAGTSRAAAGFGLEDDRKRFLYSGRLSGEKCVDLLLRAYARVADDLPDWDLVIAGDGPQRSALEGEVPAALGERVRWLGFVPSREELGEVYRSCHVLAVPSEYEPWGVVVLEGAAAALALVVSDVVGAAHELVRDGDNGYVVASGSVDSLAAALRAAATRAAEMGERSSSLLDEWCRRSDPVAGLRSALSACGFTDREAAA